MRGTFKYGIPAAAGLGLAAYGAQQGATPGETALVGGTAALGGAAGLLGARALAGKYNPALVAAAQKNVTRLGNKIGDVARDLPEKGLRRGAANVAADVVSAADARLFGDPTAGISAAIPFPTQGVQRNIGKGIAAGLVPGAALSSAGGGIALSQIPAALGAPGFVQNQALDPESYGSSNSPGARYKASTMQYM
jgi:hypothetical protein